MTDRDSFLRAIRADPDDDTVRLVFADFLEESGDESRADFIRVQCRLARRFADVPRIPNNYRDHWTGISDLNPGRHLCDHGPDDLLCCWPGEGSLRSTWCLMHRDVHRQAELLGFDPRRGYCPSQARRDWAGRAFNLPWYRFDRGFVHHVEGSAAEWLAYADRILAEHPVRRVTLTARPEWYNIGGGLLIQLESSGVTYTCHRARPGLIPWAPPGGYYLDIILAHEWPGVEFTVPPPQPTATLERRFHVLATSPQAAMSDPVVPRPGSRDASGLTLTRLEVEGEGVLWEVTATYS